MTPEAAFSACNMAVVPAWALLLFAPRWRGTERLVRSGLYSLLFCVLYAVLLATHFLGAPGGFGSLAEVATLFQNPWLLLAGWVHYLAFDLFIGAWEVTDGVARGLSAWVVGPCLVLTFLVGPVGLLLYFMVRRAGRRARA